MRALDDGLYLRRAIELSATGRSRGNRPFGAVIIGADGALLAEAWCDTAETGDCTSHAEVNAIREAHPRHGRTLLEGATLYSSAEPCVMCAGAIFWSGLRRVVFGIDAKALRVFRGGLATQRDAELGCREVFAAAPYAIECLGPMLVEEAAAVHRGFWR